MAHDTKTKRAKPISLAPLSFVDAVRGLGLVNQGETAIIQSGVWHDWWNAGDCDARVRVEITPGERFVHMIETFFGLARLGQTARACHIRCSSP